MVYLQRFNLLNELQEHDILCNKKNIYKSVYPIHIFTLKELNRIEFNDITCFYGGNGSGKTTLLNIISQKLKASRKNIIKISEIFDDYVDITSYDLYHEKECKEIKFISSDDIFDYLLDLRAINSNVERRKEELSNEYLESKFDNIDFSFNDYENLKNKFDSRHMTHSKYVRSRLTNYEFVMHSNGESALEFWENEIKENGIYILDEPENSLSAENQIKLKTFIEESARFFNCQFIISTHSPFLLALENAKIYDLDSSPVSAKKWTELKNVKTYYNFFNEHKSDFEN